MVHTDFFSLAISAHSLRRPRKGLCSAGQAAGEVTVVVLLELIVSARPIRRTEILNSMSGGLHVEQPDLRPRGCGHHFLHLIHGQDITLGDSYLDRRKPELAQLENLPLICWMGDPHVDHDRVSIFVVSQDVWNESAKPGSSLLSMAGGLWHNGRHDT